MARYRVKRKRIVRQDETLEPGDVIEPTDAELRAFGDNLDPVSETADETDADTDADSARDADDGADGADETICGVELSSGGTCDRPAATCPYHDTEAGA